MATTREKVAGLYIAFFNRAPDKAGLDYWESRAEELGDDRAIKELSSGFASSTLNVIIYTMVSQIGSL